MGKCPLDGKRCYIKDPYVRMATCFIGEEKPKKCRHGEFYHDTWCPAFKDKKNRLKSHRLARGKNGKE